MLRALYLTAYLGNAIFATGLAAIELHYINRYSFSTSTNPHLRLQAPPFSWATVVVLLAAFTNTLLLAATWPGLCTALEREIGVPPTVLAIFFSFGWIFVFVWIVLARYILVEAVRKARDWWRS
jgi:hypothetical protein